MRISFFDTPGNAFTKFFCAFLTYCSGIYLVDFAPKTILPVLLVFIISGISDYIMVAFLNKRKHPVLRTIVFILLFYWSVYAIVVFSFIVNNKIGASPNTLYITSSIMFIVPLVDSFIGFFAELINDAEKPPKSVTDGAAYFDMVEYLDRTVSS